MKKNEGDFSKIGFSTLLITLGIVFGDIGTSPLYVMAAITGGENFDPNLVFGSLSCIVWTLLILATIKYIYLALNNDNNGEGGIFSLYALLRKTNKKWIVFPALVGCATLISDGFITPAISISSAVEGLSEISPHLPVLPIVCTIVIALFLIQQFGTNILGRLFGPVMFTWFLVLGILGLYHLIRFPEVLKALNPLVAMDFLISYPGGFWILGAVFLCTTGAEALYSDLGHCGKRNIRYTWYFVLSMLLLNYFGQAAFCLSDNHEHLDSVFYAMVPTVFLPYVILIATAATIIASQALITGIFTLVSEAIKLRLWTNMKVKYPSELKGQVYIPFINYFLLFGCLAVIVIFRESSNMESAYGLAITIDMLMTSILLITLIWYKYPKRRSIYLLVFSIILSLEVTFLLSNFNKLSHGGWFTLLLATILFFLLLLHYHARKLRSKVAEYKNVKSVIPTLVKIRDDNSIPFLTNNLIYPVRSGNVGLIDSTVVHSLFNGRPKRAAIYWFLHLKITDVPWGVEYITTTLAPKYAFFVKLQLGFKEPHLVKSYLKEIHKQMADAGEIDKENVFKSVGAANWPVDFRFVVINSRVASDNKLSYWDMLAVRVYRSIKITSLSPLDDFGLDKTNAEVELIPVNVRPAQDLHLVRKLH